MFEASVVGVGKDVEAVSILADLFQPLELQCVHEAHDEGREAHFSMHPSIERENRSISHLSKLDINLNSRIVEDLLSRLLGQLAKRAVHCGGGGVHKIGPCE